MKSTTTVSNIKTEFSLKNATAVGGAKPFLEYLEKINLAEALNKLNCIKQGNSLFPVYQILLYLIIGWTLGCQRLFHFRSFQTDELIRRFLGGRCPHHTLLYKELDRLSKSRPTLTLDLKKLNMEVITPCLPLELIVDLDSTVETVYGNQEGAAVGTNSHKPGRKSYHPLMAFEGQSRLCLNAVLSAGNEHSSRNADEFMKQAFELLGDRRVKYARFDKGFGGEEFYSLWESKNIGYVGKQKWTKRLQTEVAKCRCWKRFVDKEWVIEGITLIYKATSWKKARRVAIIRKAQRFYGEQVQMLLYTDWQYEAIDLWHFYNQRCCMENYIKESKRGFSIDRIATGNFHVNEIDMHLKLLAYNLYERFKKDCCEPIHQGYTIARFRLEFFQCAAILVRHSRSNVLKLAKYFWNRHAWQRLATRVAALE